MSRRMKKHEEPMNGKMGIDEQVREIAERTGISMYKVRQVLNAYGEVAQEALTKERSISIPGIGIIRTKTLRETTNYIPSRDEYVTTEQRSTAVLKPSAPLKRALNPDPETPVGK